MAVENAIEFLAEASQNSSLQERLQQVNTPEDILQIAREQGYEISADDMKLATQAAEAVESGSGELSDDELEAVAGGFGFSDILRIGGKVVDAVSTHGPTVLRVASRIRRFF